jgi:hypothetical protein
MVEKLKLWEVRGQPGPFKPMNTKIVRGANVLDALQRARSKTGEFRLQFIEYVMLIAEED